MVVSLLSPGAASRIGPGIELLVHTSIVGPLVTGTYAEAILTNPANGLELVRGSAVYGASGALSHDAIVVLGIGVPEDQVVIPQAGQTDGGALTLTLNTWTPAGAHLENAVLAGMLWDANSGAWYLSTPSAATPTGGILAAVQKTYQNTP